VVLFIWRSQSNLTKPFVKFGGIYFLKLTRLNVVLILLLNFIRKCAAYFFRTVHLLFQIEMHYNYVE